MRTILWLVIPTLTLIAASSSSQDKLEKEKAVVACGSTLAAPLYQLAIADFEHDHPEAHLFYNHKPFKSEEKPCGSVTGIRLFRKHKIDFTGTDWPETQVTDTIQYPAAIGGIVIVYRFPPVYGVADKPLNLTAEVLAEIFQGTITRWDSPYIRRDNPEARLPSEDIVPVVRNDGSGTTHIFSCFLKKLSISWRGGCDFKVNKWAKSSIKVDGNEALAKKVHDTDYAIGYVEYEYAMQDTLAQARIENKAGKFVAANAGSLRAASPPDLVGGDAQKQVHAQEMFPTAKVESAYPISGFTWLLVPKHPREQSSEVLCSFLDFLPGWIDLKAHLSGYAAPSNDQVDENRIVVNEVCRHPEPSIVSFNPASGPIGTQVTILGTNLKTATRVKFGGVNATIFSVDSDTQIMATVPTVETGKVKVTTFGGTTTAATEFTVTQPEPTPN